MVDPGKLLLLSQRRHHLNCPQMFRTKRTSHSRRTFIGCSAFVHFRSHYTKYRDDVALLGRTSAFLRHLLACCQPSHTRPMCPHTLHGGRHTIVMSCYFFPMQTRLPSSRSRPARSREIISMYGTSCRSMHWGLMAEAHICGGQSGIRRVRGSGERSSVSPPT